MTDKLTSSASFRTTFEAAKQRLDREVGVGLIRQWPVFMSEDDEDSSVSFTTGGVITESEEDGLEPPHSKSLVLEMRKRRQAADEFTFETVDAAFASLKGRMTEVTTTKEKMQATVAHAIARANNARKIHQDLYADRMMDVAASVALEAQAIELGFNRWIEASIVNRVARARQNRHLNMEMTNLSSFPRAIPNDVAEKITALRPIFDEFSILFTNPLKESVAPVSKDPILFGTLNAFPERLYYIDSWEDEFCNLTLEKFITLAKEEVHPDWEVEVSTDVTDKDIEDVIAWSKSRNLLRPVPPPTLFNRFRYALMGFFS